MLRIVLDTNVVLSSISRKSPYHSILTDLFDDVYELCITTEILLEYEEKLTDNFSEKVAVNFISALLAKTTIERIDVYFYLDIIRADKDNKFVNCAFAGNVNYLVTNDKHFDILKKLSFPKINILSAEEFLHLLSDIRNEGL